MPEKSRYNSAKKVPTFEDKGRNQGGNSIKMVPTFSNFNNLNEIENKEIWISVREGGNLLGITERAVKKNCKNGKYTTKMIRANGGWQYRILLSSLPVEAQIRYWQQARQQQSDKKILVPSSVENPLNINEEDKKVALARGDLLRLYLDACSGKNKMQKKRKFIQKYNEGAFNDLLKILGRVSFQTIERWKKIWIENECDDMVLVPRHKREPKGRKITREQGEILIEKALSPNKWKFNKIVREARKTFAEKGIQCDACDMTLIRYIKDWKKKNIDLWRLMREGESALNDKELFYLERDYDQIEVGDVLVADGHTLNFNILNPWTGKPKRMTLILVYDMKSNFPVGWEIMPTENTQAIAAAFRRGILFLKYLPRVFYLDNGKAFRSKYFSGTRDFRTSAITGLFERLGVQVIYAWAYHGQSKTVERFFGSYLDMEQSLPTYVGNSIDNKPAHMRRGEKWHIKLHEKLTMGAVPTLEETHWMVAQWITEYVQRKQQDGHLKGQRPIDVFAEGVDRARSKADFGDRAINEAELDYLMMEAKISTLYRNGIRLFGKYYFNEKFYSLEKGRGKHQFLIRYDIANKDYILVYDQSGSFHCKAYRTDKIHPVAAQLGSDEDVMKLQDNIRMKRRLVKETRAIANALVEHIGKRQIAQEDDNPLKGKLTPPPQAKDDLNYFAPVNKKKAEDDLILFAPVNRKEEEIYMFRTDKELAERRAKKVGN